MNESFREGLNEFVEQLSAYNTSQAVDPFNPTSDMRGTPMSSYGDQTSAIMQLIETNQLARAFELVYSFQYILLDTSTRIEISGSFPERLFAIDACLQQGWKPLRTTIDSTDVHAYLRWIRTTYSGTRAMALSEWTCSLHYFSSYHRS